VQVNVPFFKCVDYGEEFFIPNPIIALSRSYFLGNECNWVEDELSIFEMLLRENPRDNIIRSIHLNESFEFGVKIA